MQSCIHIATIMIIGPTFSSSQTRFHLPLIRWVHSTLPNNRGRNEILTFMNFNYQQGWAAGVYLNVESDSRCGSSGGSSRG